ncbi:MAG: T9SS type A sorting domain-containing protein [Bacteroidetes bacterium]|nr:T9SS type A sorting domain-containing protein [Bacteroidota bacterium]MBI3483199.1 T9SS type A sorting domain-containing protein [Bacteroidota bacterium]
MKTLRVTGGLMGLVISFASFGQTCTSSPLTVGSNSNFTSITWAGTGGVTAAQCTAIANGTNTTTVANFRVDLNNSVVLTISNNVTIHGTFDITGGPGSELSVNGGGGSTTLHVTGDLGDATNNGVIYNVQGSNDHMQVDGTLYGKNNDALTGSGTISGGAINVKNGTTCGSPCPASGGFTTCTAGDSFCTTYSVLPITLLFFKGDLSQDNVVLTWATAAELNFDYFSLERSSEGKLFNEITQVKGHGTTNEMHQYSFEDNDPIIGRSYYRLTSIDFDRYTETFPVVLVEYHGEKKFQISPNPSDGATVKLDFNFENDADGQVTIYDNLGSAIGTYNVQGSGSINFENTLKSGIYLAKYTSAAFTKTERFLVK